MPLKDGLSPEEADKESRSEVYHDFVLTDERLWENIRSNPLRLPENFSKVLKIIAEKNPELKGVVDRADFIHSAKSKDNLEILRQLVELFSKKKLYEVSPDILGEAYEWFLRYFAPEKAKARFMGEKVYNPVLWLQRHASHFPQACERTLWRK
ncbi:MAG: type I restriction-modification system subunit M N-terminal domain-containing protein [Archaeoglobaceae archaeon]